MPTVPPAPGSFNGYDENHLGAPRTRATPLPDELSVAGAPLLHEAEGSLLDDEMRAALAEMVDDAAVQRADEVLGAELAAAARWLRMLFPHEDYLHVARSFGVRVLSGHVERYVNYAAWVGDVIEPGTTPMDAARKAARRVRGTAGQAQSTWAVVTNRPSAGVNSPRPLVWHRDPRLGEC